MTNYDKWIIIGLVTVVVGLASQVFFLVMMVIELGGK